LLTLVVSIVSSTCILLAIGSTILSAFLIFISSTSIIISTLLLTTSLSKIIGTDSFSGSITSFSMALKLLFSGFSSSSLTISISLSSSAVL